jgi:glucokinase
MIQSLVKTKVLGVDIGLEKTTYAIVDVRGNILAKDSFQTQDYPNFNTFLSVFCERAINLIMSNGEYEEIRSMGVSAPSANLLTGNIEYSGNLPWQGEIPLSAVLRDRLGLAVAVANDAHVRALGESTYGCAHGMKDFIYLTLGHGIGSCIFSNGHAHLGSNGFGGEIGHCCIYPGGRQCTCGSRGCLEAYCGANGIVQTAKEMMAESDQPSLMREQAELTPKLIAELCDQGDEMAIEVFRRTGFILGIALANYASVINPEAIILSGGIAKAGEWLLKPLNDSFEEHVFHNIENKVKFMYSTLNDEERNVLGASALAWSVKEYSLFK